MVGRLFNIQRFSVHDGPGIRTTLFFKGCNLRCRWCHNPESYKAEPQIQYLREKCIGCGECQKACKQGIHIEDGKRIGIENCILCQKCVDACMSGALKYAGKEYALDELTDIALRDKDYYINSGGGVTASGGEPLLQYEFVTQLFKRLKEEGISTALDTAGNVPFQYFEKVLPYTDIVLLDMKIMNAELHRMYTGADNYRIIENAKKLMKMGQRMHIRVPVMEGVNDTVENALALKKLIGENRCVEEVRLLPYHNMGLAKAASVNLEMNEFSTPEKEKMDQLRDVFGSLAR